MKNTFSSFIFGGIIGAIIALLFAPRSGEETRQIIVEKGETVRDNTLRSIREAQDVALASLNEAQARIDVINKEIKAMLSDLQEIGKTVAAEQREAMEVGLQDAKDTVEL